MKIEWNGYFATIYDKNGEIIAYRRSDAGGPYEIVWNLQNKNYLNFDEEFYKKIEEKVNEEIKEKFLKPAMEEMKSCKELHEKISVIWDSDESIREELFRSLEINFQECMITKKSSNIDYYSFYSFWDLKGKKMFSVPYQGLQFLDYSTINLCVGEAEYYYTREPENINMSNNGGDYYAGYIIEEVDNGLLMVHYCSCLHSDFQSSYMNFEGFHTRESLSRLLSDNDDNIKNNIS